LNLRHDSARARKRGAALSKNKPAKQTMKKAKKILIIQLVVIWLLAAACIICL
jgi:flagellar basal body-associated protein FliL